MASKYDTNPLDPDFPKKAGHSGESSQTQSLSDMGEETRVFSGRRSFAEEPTRRYENANFAQYSSAYAQPQVGKTEIYKATSPVIEKPTNRKVEGTGMPENVLMILPYAPFGVGLVASIIELLCVSQSESKIRFHSAQALATHITILFISVILGFIGNFSDYADNGGKVFAAITTVLLIIAMVRVWNGKPLHIEWIEPLTNWLSDKIKLQPKNK